MSGGFFKRGMKLFYAIICTASFVFAGLSLAGVKPGELPNQEQVGIMLTHGFEQAGAYLQEQHPAWFAAGGLLAWYPLAALLMRKLFPVTSQALRTGEEIRNDVACEVLPDKVAYVLGWILSPIAIPTALTFITTIIGSNLALYALSFGNVPLLWRKSQSERAKQAEQAAKDVNERFPVSVKTPITGGYYQVKSGPVLNNDHDVREKVRETMHAYIHEGERPLPLTLSRSDESLKSLSACQCDECQKTMNFLVRMKKLGVV